MFSALPQGQGLGQWNSYGHGTLTQALHKRVSDGVMNWTANALPESPGIPLIGVWQSPSENQSTPNDTDHLALSQGQEMILGPEFGSEERPDTHSHVHNQFWTTVTDDGAFVEHLMALYFCWEYPTFASLSKEHFLDDFRDGRRRHCSSLLVNAMLALGCKFSNQPASRTDPSDSRTAGNHFFAEAARLLELESDRHLLTTIQALGLMAIREASCGRSSDSLFLSGQSIRLAIEMGLHLDAQKEGGEAQSIDQAVRSATFWGAFSLDQ